MAMAVVGAVVMLPRLWRHVHRGRSGALDASAVAGARATMFPRSHAVALSIDLW